MASTYDQAREDDDITSDDLADAASDKLALTARVVGAGAALLGSGAGIVAPIVGEIISHVIPGQRADRIQRFLATLEAKLEELDQRLLEQEAQNERFVDVLEDGLHQAARALSQERLDYITSLIKNSLSEVDVAYTRTKWMLYLLGQLNDAEIILLKSHAFVSHSDEERQFYEKHQHILTTPAITFGAPEEDVDEQAVRRSYSDHMMRLGLLRHTYKRIKKDELPEFDPQTGMIKSKGVDITRLGRLLLRHIDQLPNPTYEVTAAPPSAMDLGE